MEGGGLGACIGVRRPAGPPPNKASSKPITDGGRKAGPGIERHDQAPLCGLAAAGPYRRMPSWATITAFASASAIVLGTSEFTIVGAT